jgi:hypothetical protein
VSRGRWSFLHPVISGSHVKNLTHFSGVPNVAQLIAKKLFCYPVAETRLSACLLFLSACLLSDFQLQIASNAVRYRNIWVTPGKLPGAPLWDTPLSRTPLWPQLWLWPPATKRKVTPTSDRVPSPGLEP